MYSDLLCVFHPDSGLGDNLPTFLPAYASLQGAFSGRTDKNKHTAVEQQLTGVSASKLKTFYRARPVTLPLAGEVADVLAYRNHFKDASPA